MLAQIGEQSGYTIWIPEDDRPGVLQEWQPGDGVLIEVLPLNQGEATVRTIQQIGVVWFEGRIMARAFEVAHTTTTIQAGLLRMSDLVALQPNLDVKLHIVGPASIKAEALQELQRPVFSSLEKGSLSELCTFVALDNLRH